MEVEGRFVETEALIQRQEGSCTSCATVSENHADRENAVQLVYKEIPYNHCRPFPDVTSRRRSSKFPSRSNLRYQLFVVSRAGLHNEDSGAIN